MSKSMASGNSLKQFFENIATAKVVHLTDVEYLIGVKDGKFFRVEAAELTPYLRVTPEGVQWVKADDPAEYDVESNTNWEVE